MSNGFWSFPTCPFCGDPLLSHGRTCLPCPPWEGPSCGICGQMLLGELSDRCWKCRSLKWNLDEGRFAFPYRGLWKQLIQDYKIGLMSGHGGFIGRVMGALVSDHRPLVPVPGNPANNFERGFDPVQTLVKALAREKKLPVLQLFRRIRGRSQKELGRQDRRRSIAEGILLPGTPACLPRKVYLVDDVFTTGATANHCAGLLKQAGVEEVVLLAAAGP